MISLRVHGYTSHLAGTNQYLWLFPGTFFIIEEMPRLEGSVVTRIIIPGYHNPVIEGIRVVETAKEIEDKIKNAP